MLTRLLVTMAALLAAPPSALAAERLTIFDLVLGSGPAELPDESKFGGLACGSNGGPPLRKISQWSDSALCEPEVDGVHEVYLEYSEVAEDAARRRQDYVAGWFLGTQFDFFPIVASALFNDEGTLVGVRLVTDPRPEQRKDPFFHLRPRAEHYLMRLHLMEALQLDDDGCMNLPMQNGESAVLGMFDRTSCEWDRDGRLIHIESTLVRKRGQREIDPATGQLTEGEFESITRAEIRLAP